jgi:hypothetical protein
MNPITRRWCLLAVAGAPIVLGISAQELSVRLDNDYLRVSAPKLDFLTDQPLKRLMDGGKTVGYLGQLTVSTGADRILQGRAIGRFAFSYDIWTERFKVTLLTPGQKSSSPIAKSNLTREGAQAWCLEQLKIDLTHLPIDRPILVRLEMRSEDPKETDGIIGEPGISLSGLIVLFSHPVKDKQQVHVVREISVTLADLRRARS